VSSPLDTIFGLPTHVLVVHAAVVLLPLGVLGGIGIVLFRRAINPLGLITVLVAGTGAVAAFASKGSGEQLASRVGSPQPHVEYGEVLPFYAAALFVILLAYWLFARGVPGNRTRPWWVITLGVLVVIAGLVLVWFTIVTGHSGAAATWEAVIDNTTPGQFPIDE
jgi:hypothetical protein